METEIVAGIASALSPIFEDVWDGLKATTLWAKEKTWDRAKWEELAREYGKNLQEQYGTIQILSQPEPRPLSNVYTEVFLHERPTHSYAMGIKELEENFRERGRFGRQERHDGLAIAVENPRLFILGKPGAGKTTFLKHFAMQAAEGKLRNAKGKSIKKIPVFISLNDLARKNLTIIEYMASRFDICQFPNADAKLFIKLQLEKGNLLVLFDGLDEVRREGNNRTNLTQELKDFIDKYKNNQFAITCRIAASDYNFTDFKYVEMADFTEEQVENFVCGWFLEDEIKLDGFLEELEKTSNKKMKEMTTSPLLLTLLCIQYDGSMAFPPYRSEIYEKALTVLLETWDTHRSIQRDPVKTANSDRDQVLTTKRKMQLMSRLAYFSFLEGDLFIRQTWLENRIAKQLAKMPNFPEEDLIEGDQVLKGLESGTGLLVERAERIFSFSHLTLQEYFTAKYIERHTNKILPELVTEERLTDSRWREVFLFVAELLEEGDALVLGMAQTLQKMVNGGGVKPLVEWVQKRSLERAFASGQMSSRIGYLASASALASAHTLASASALDIASARTLDIASASARARASALARASPLASTLALASALALALARPRASALDGALASASDLFIESMRIAIEESRLLEWKELHVALKQVPELKRDSTRKEIQTVVSQIRKIETKIILENWEWDAQWIEPVELLTKWLNGHELLFECLDRVILDELDRETFEDEMLYCLPKGEPTWLMRE